MKKILIIVIIVLALITAALFIKGFLKEGKGGIFGKIPGNIFTKEQNLMDMMGKDGQKVMSKSEYIAGCKKSDADTQDMCYALGALYYRDASLCKLVKDTEAQKSCTKEKIEECYSDLKKCFSGLVPGGAMIPTGGTIPSGGTESEGGLTQPEIIPDGQEKPILGGKMTDEIYVEMLAQTSYYAQKYGQDPKSFAAHMKSFYDKYGITPEDIEAYSKELEKDPQRAGELGMKYIKRAQELQGMGL